MNKFLDIHWLKANHQMIHFFGLGFIQIKIDEKRRLHFYHSELPPFVDQPHNHRYDFTSMVLKGSLKNVIWVKTDNPNGEPCVHRYDSCTSDDSIVLPETKETRRLIFNEFSTSKGSSYSLRKEMFHQVIVEQYPTITLLTRGPKEYEFASILEPLDYQPVCPFSRNLPEDELWVIVEKCLTDD